MRVRRRGNRTRCRRRARKRGEDRALTHGVAVSGDDRAEHADLQVRDVARGDGDRDGGRVAVGPVGGGDGEGGAREAGEQVWRREDLDTVFLGPFAAGLVVVARRVGARDHDAPVEEGDGFGVVEAGYGRVGHDGHA